MTTIAYRDGIMVADSQMTSGILKIKSDPKILRINETTWLGGAGDVEDLVKMYKFFREWKWGDFDAKPPKMGAKTEAIIVHEGTAYWCQGSCIPVPLANPYYAIGSGWVIAMAAMTGGASAKEAVLLASKLDIYTNDELQVVNVQDVQGQAKAQRGRAKAPRVQEAKAHDGRGPG